MQMPLYSIVWPGRYSERSVKNTVRVYGRGWPKRLLL